MFANCSSFIFIFILFLSCVKFLEIVLFIHLFYYFILAAWRNRCYFILFAKLFVKWIKLIWKTKTEMIKSINIEMRSHRTVQKLNIHIVICLLTVYWFSRKYCGQLTALLCSIIIIFGFISFDFYFNQFSFIEIRFLIKKLKTKKNIDHIIIISFQMGHMKIGLSYFDCSSD